MASTWLGRLARISTRALAPSLARKKKHKLGGCQIVSQTGLLGLVHLQSQLDDWLPVLCTIGGGGGCGGGKTLAPSSP